MSVKPIPEGYHTVTPYLIVRGVAKVLEFAKAALGALETERFEGPEGIIAHAEIRIGDSVVMLGEARGQYQPMPSMLYVYVADVDAVYRKALAAGGVSVTEPDDKFYGDRSGGVQDPAGNYWYIATRVEDVSSAELQRRVRAAMA